MSGGASAWGLRSLADGYLRYFQPGLPCYLRFQTVQADDTTEYASLGFMPSVTGALSGVQDVLIDPPPDVQEVSLHNIGIMGARLQFGARRFLISHTFVREQMRLRELTDPYKVFRDSSVMGIYYNHRLFSIESLTHEDVGGEPTLWTVIANSYEEASPSE